METENPLSFTCCQAATLRCDGNMTASKRSLLSIYIPQSDSRAGCYVLETTNGKRTRVWPPFPISIRCNRSTCLSPCQVVAPPPPPPLRKPGGGRRRQLVFADPVVQISDGAMKEQIGHPRAETLSLVEKPVRPFERIPVISNIPVW